MAILVAVALMVDGAAPHLMFCLVNDIKTIDYSGKLIRSKYIARVGECLSFSEGKINPHFS